MWFLVSWGDCNFFEEGVWVLVFDWRWGSNIFEIDYELWFLGCGFCFVELFFLFDEEWEEGGGGIV